MKMLCHWHRTSDDFFFCCCCCYYYCTDFIPWPSPILTRLCGSREHTLSNTSVPRDGGRWRGCGGAPRKESESRRDGTGRDGTTASSHLDSYTVFPFKCFFEKRERKNIYIYVLRMERETALLKKNKKNTHIHVRYVQKNPQKINNNKDDSNNNNKKKKWNFNYSNKLIQTSSLLGRRSTSKPKPL